MGHGVPNMVRSNWLLFVNKLGIFFILLVVLDVSLAHYSPCYGKSQLGGECDEQDDCELKGSICLRGQCRCHPHYIQVVDEKGKNPHCKLLPNRIGAPCTTKCREPLFCRNGGCQCVQRGTTTLINGECISASRVGDRCTRHYDCTAPFSACLNQQCVCISGTMQQGSRCVAAANCPFGGLPGASCILKTLPSMAFNLPQVQSNCPLGQVCVTAEESAVGHCCPIVCPLASHVDTAWSCDPNATMATRCPSDTHFCHLLSDGHFSQAVCCRRPCNAMAPNALYANHECVPRGQLNAACTTNAQCAGGEGMECVKGQCQCMSGFTPSVDSLTKLPMNPSQTCTRDCSSMDLARDTFCFKGVNLGEQCFIQKQCPPNSGCYRGRCMCRCGFERSGKSARCSAIPPPPTTTARPAANIAPGGDILGIFGRFFGVGSGAVSSAAGQGKFPPWG